MTKVSDSICKALGEAVAYSQGTGDAKAFRVSAAVSFPAVT